jgi:hypothetical protein
VVSRPLLAHCFSLCDLRLFVIGRILLSQDIQAGTIQCMMEHVLADSSLAAPPVAPHGAEAVDAGEYRAYFDDALERISKLQHSNNEDIVALRAQLEQEREDALRQRDERHAVALAALETRAAAAEADAKLLRSQLERLRAEDTELAGLTRAQSAAAHEFEHKLEAAQVEMAALKQAAAEQAHRAEEQASPPPPSY